MDLGRSPRRWLLVFLALTMCFLRGTGAPRRVAAQNSPIPAAAPSRSGLTGLFSLLWEDPPPGAPPSPGPIPLLTDDQGRTHRLFFPEGLAEKLGGVQGLDQHRLNVNGEWVGQPGDAIAVSGLQEVALPTHAEPFAAAEASVPVVKRYAMILCRFSDTSGFTPHPASWYAGLMSDVFPGATHFWQEASYSAIAFSGSVVFGWYNLPRPRSYYVNAAGTAMDLDKLFVDATAAANADVYFPDFAGINILVNDNLVGAAYGSTARQGAMDGVTRTWAVTWLPLWGHNPGILGHEMGHTLGLPHSSGPYKDTYDSRWDVMSGGAYGSTKTADAIYGTTPTHPIAWHKDKLGYIPAKRKFIAQPGTSTTIALTRVSQPLSDDDYLMAQIFIGGWGSRFYTVELRQFSGYDAVGGLPGEAVVLHKVDTTLSDRNAQVVDADGNGNTNDEGAMWRPGETFTDSSNEIAIAVADTTATGVRVTITVGSDVPLPSVVSSTADQGPGSLRNAIHFANQFPGTTIQFSVPQGDAGFSNGVVTLQPTVPLPSIQGNTILIDGGSQLSRTGDTNSGLPVLVVNGARAGAGAVGLQITGSGCQVRRITINGFAGDGVRILGAGAVGNAVQGCLVGTNPTGAAAQPNGGFGIVVFAGAKQTMIGGSVAASGNLVSGNGLDGIRIEGSGTAETLVQGNFVGTDSSGSRAIPNGAVGIDVAFGARNNTIGGLTAGARNLISGNRGPGLVFYGSGTDGNVAQGNFIGTNAAGQLAVPNGTVGVIVFGGAKGNTIGGSAVGAGNVISGNTAAGVAIQGDSTSGTGIQGNLIGTDASGTTVLPNGANAVEIGFATQSNILGGTTAGARNLIASNRDAGVLLYGAGTRGNLIQGNSIGTDPSGARRLGSSSYGIAIIDGASGNTVGGDSAAAGNQIAFRGFSAILVQDATSNGNTFRGNSLFRNSGLGINLWGGAENGFGVTNNDPADTDTGPNNLQNYPVIGDVTVSGGETTVSGTLNSTPGATFALDFYTSPVANPSGFGEGALYLGTTSITTDSRGGATFEFRVANALTDQFVTATATNTTTGDTSEFSQAKKGS